jgi:hypothetical protein
MAKGEHGIKKPIVMPDVFKGDIEEDWEDWIKSFNRFFKLWVACRPSYKLAKLLRMTFLEPDLFRMLCFKTVLCHEMVYQPFRSPLCFLEFSNLMSVDLRFNNNVTSRQVFDKLKSLKRKIKTILPTAVVGFVRIPTLSFVKYRVSTFAFNLSRSCINLFRNCHFNLHRFQVELSNQLYFICENSDLILCKV